MNKNRRKEIAQAIAKLNELQTLKDEIVSMIETVRDDEQEYYDNMPESLQTSDKGYAAETAISQLEDTLSQIEDIDTETLISNLEEAAE